MHPTAVRAHHSVRRVRYHEGLIVPHVDVVGQVKRFGALTAVDGLCLAVTAGEVHGFLGPNGAGKSTTIRTLLGLYRADAGTVTVLGGDPARNAA